MEARISIIYKCKWTPYDQHRESLLPLSMNIIDEVIKYKYKIYELSAGAAVWGSQVESYTSKF